VRGLRSGKLPGTPDHREQGNSDGSPPRPPAGELRPGKPEGNVPEMPQQLRQEAPGQDHQKQQAGGANRNQILTHLGWKLNQNSTMMQEKKIETSLLYVSNKFITHLSKADWGGSIWIMEKEGRAFARAYRYCDDDKTIYLDNLSVSWDARKEGLGTKLQKIRESIGRYAGFKEACLWATKGTWQHDWYQRRGYVDYQDYPDEINAVWMKKSLINN